MSYRISILAFFLLFNLTSIPSVYAITIPVNQVTKNVTAKQVKKSKKRKKPNFIQRFLIKKLTKKLKKKLNNNKEEKEIRTNSTLSWMLGLASLNALVFAFAFSSAFLFVGWGVLALLGLIFGILARINSRFDKEKYFKERQMANVGVWIGVLSLILPLIAALVVIVVLITTFN